MGLIKLLLPFCPPCLDYLQERPKHNLDRHFIHKSVRKCDIIMQNCKLINYTGYIRFKHVERLQVDPGSALSNIPKRLFYFLSIPFSRLTTTTMTIYGFNAGCSHPLRKVRLRRQIGDLKSEVTCYIIDADASYNLLLG